MDGRIARLGSPLLAAIVAFGLTACGDTTGPEGMATAAVQLNRLGGGSAAIAASAVSSDPRFAAVDLGDVAAIRVDVDSVELHRIGEGGEGEGEENGGGPSAGWYGLAVEVASLDLLDLPTDQALTLASGSVPAGTYNQLRLFVTGTTVDFAEGFDPDGEAGPLEAGATDVPLTIPSADQSGIKVPGLSFVLEEDAEGELTITFDDGASVRNVTVTGDGQVKMNPVLKLEGGAPAGS